MDLRKPTHFQVNLPVSFSGDRVAGEGTVYNLSTGGCKAEQDSPITVAVAAVRWAMGRDFGVEFISLPADDQEHLRRYLQTLETSSGT